MATRTISNAGGAWNTVGAWVEGVVPTTADDVIATGTSGNVSIPNGGANCRSADFTNYVGTLSGTLGGLNIGDGTAGSGNVALKLSAGMTLTHSGSVHFNSTAVAQQTITTAGKTLTCSVFFNTAGNYLLADALVQTHAGGISVLRGTVNFGNQNVTTPFLRIRDLYGAVNVTLGSGTFTITGAGTAWEATNGGALTFSGASAIIALTNASGSAKTFAGGGLTYGTLTSTAGGSGGLTITGSNTFGTLTITTTAARTVTFTDGTTQTVSTSLTLTGESGQLLTLAGSAAGGWTIAVPGTQSISYVSVSRSTATGNAARAGLTSTDGGNNTNWTFIDVPTSDGSYLTLFGPTGLLRRR